MPERAGGAHQRTLFAHEHGTELRLQRRELPEFGCGVFIVAQHAGLLAQVLEQLLGLRQGLGGPNPALQ